MSGRPECQDLSSRQPRVDDLLLYGGQTYSVTDYSTYKNEEGYRVEEWCCEAGGKECYLLKEWGSAHEFKWFFTAYISTTRVTLPNGQPVPEWDWRDGQPLIDPPKTLMIDGNPCAYAGSTDGTYEDDPGDDVRKITWDYWDAGHKHNLAVELWGNGGVDFYFGRYIEPGEARLRRSSRSGRSSSGDGHAGEAQPLGTVLVFLGGGLVVAFMFAGDGTIPFDVAFSLLLPPATLGAYFYSPLTDLPGDYQLIAALAAAAQLVLFGRFPPLSSVVGLAALLSPSVALGLRARGKPDAPSDRARLRWLAAFASFLPACCWGAYYYFHYAPAPHDFDQYLGAYVPAVCGALAAWLIAGGLVPAQGGTAPGEGGGEEASS